MKRYLLNTETSFTGKPAPPIRKPFPHEVPEIDPISNPPVLREHQVLTEVEIEELTSLWARLLHELDHQSDRWYARDEERDWFEISFPAIHDFLYDMGIGSEPEFEKILDPDTGEVTGWRLVPDPERVEIIRQFRLRDSQRKSGGRATRRDTDDIKRAQERFGKSKVKPASRGFWPIDPIDL
jgi:hypothetical protein